MYERETNLQFISYIFNKTKVMAKGKLLTYAYLADKLHLYNYARKISNFNYKIDEYLDSKDLDLYMLEFAYRNNLKDNDYDCLSESDIEVIDLIIEKFSGIDVEQYVMSLPELKCKDSCEISTNDMLESFDVDLAVKIFNYDKERLEGIKQIVQERVEIAKAIINGELE
jgi:hypothetical protein